MVMTMGWPQVLTGRLLSKSLLAHVLRALFGPDMEEFSTYLERVEIFFAANDVLEDKKVPVFLNAIGGKTYGVLHSMLSPDSSMTKTLTQITVKL